MALKLKWKNPNKVPTTIDIYRSDTHDVSLTTPLVTLSEGETEWVDTTALFGKTYYYVWVVNTDNDQVVSQPQKIEVADRHGPGPNTLLHGNENYGFFGTVSSADFVNSGVITDALKSVSGIGTAVVYPTWFKYIRKGKVLFVPSTRFTDTTWNSLYNAGAVFGTDGFGPPEFGGSVNQFTTFEFKGDLFLIRLPKGIPDGLTVSDVTGLPASGLNTSPLAVGKYSEYEDLMFPICPITPLRQRMVTVGNVDSAFILPSGYSSDRTAIGVACQETSAANNYIRGYGPYNWGAQSRASIESLGLRNRGSISCWWPVIEYVGRVDEITL
ncbi:hypothetical protein DS160_25175 [Salmonella enterica subsp. enterica serovar Enteritidis]|nr:hypothetical protein [Salmonella enterica subsp. enterica serovar Enteritidis]